MAKFNAPKNFIPLSRVAQHLGVANNTVKRWYDWFEDDNYLKPLRLILPKYHFFDKRGTKFFDINDLWMFEEFQELVNTEFRGCMAEYNKKLWKPYVKKGEQTNEI